MSGMSMSVLPRKVSAKKYMIDFSVRTVTVLLNYLKL